MLLQIGGFGFVACQLEDRRMAVVLWNNVKYRELLQMLLTERVAQMHQCCFCQWRFALNHYLTHILCQNYEVSCVYFDYPECGTTVETLRTW